MKSIKQFLILCILLICVPIFVHAGSISYQDLRKTSATTYEFLITVSDLKLNYLEGTFNVTNGTVTNIKMNSGWKNETGIANNFYFYHDGIMEGDYTVAVVEITLTGNSIYKLDHIKFGANTCTKDIYGRYFDKEGKIISKASFDTVCTKSSDATLKSLIPSFGTLSPNFKKEEENYTIEVSNNLKSISFYAHPTDESAKILTGNTCLLGNEITYCKIMVEAEAGNTKTYTIKVIKKENLSFESLDDDITEFQVHNATIDKTFHPTIYEYKVKMNQGANQMYFTFYTNKGKVKHTSDSCTINENTTKCILTVDSKHGTKKYTFFIDQEKKEDNGINQSTNNSGNTNVIDKNTTTSNKKNTSNKNNEKNQIKKPTEDVENTENNETYKKEEIKIEEQIENQNKEEIKETTEKKTNKIFAITGIIVLFLVGGILGFLIGKKKK